MKKIVIFLLLITASACTTKTEDLRSPCVSLEGGPCGPRVPLNKDLV